MHQRLPSLTALRAFEALSRHLSLTGAARELNVTPAAVSHQIKALEADLGVILLRRLNGTYVLSETAQSALPSLRAGFDQIAEAARRLRADEARYLLTISASPTFSASWLVNRLGRFKDHAPEIEVRLETTDRLADFARSGVDVGVRFGSGDYPGLEAIRLFQEQIYPVCSPALLKAGKPLASPDDLAGHTLIHVAWLQFGRETQDWEIWLRAAGASGVDHAKGPRFSHASLALQAAIAGQGVVLGSDSLAGDDLAAGRLVRPFDVSVPVDFAYYLVYPRESAGLPKIAAFRDWILGEAASSRLPLAQTMAVD